MIPDKEVAIVYSKLVVMATTGDNQNKSKMGVNTKPPPIPKYPDSIPTLAPKII